MLLLEFKGQLSSFVSHDSPENEDEEDDSPYCDAGDRE